MLRSGSAAKLPSPGLVLHFGGPVTSLILLKYLSGFNTTRYMINDYNDWTDPSRKSQGVLTLKPGQIFDYLKKNGYKPNPENAFYLRQFVEFDNEAGERNKKMAGAGRLNEINVINTLLDTVPDKSLVMSGNSLVIRDFDNFSIQLNKKIEIFSSRGASGIDGIISTAAGISVGREKKVWLVTGDLSFLYDLNSLVLLDKRSINLTIILINNSGGGIFSMLPVAGHKDVYEKYFKTSVDCDFSKIIRGFSIPYYSARTVTQFIGILKNIEKISGLSVIEVKTSSETARNLRNKLRYENNNLIIK